MAGELFLFCNYSFMHIRMTISKFFQLIYNWTCIDLLGTTCLFDLWLERTMYLHVSSILLGAKTKKILNPYSIPNECVVSCEGYGLTRSLKWNIPLYIPHLHPYSGFRNVSCIAYHSPSTTFTLASIPLSFSGGRLSFFKRCSEVLMWIHIRKVFVFISSQMTYSDSTKGLIEKNS